MGLLPLSPAAEAVSPASSPGLSRRLFEDVLSRGDLSARQGRHESALRDYRAAIKLIESDPRPLNALAWLLATCPDTALRNGREARELARRARALMPGDDWEWLAVYAAACAADGDWPSAVTYQEKALRLLPEGRKSTWLANYEERLRRYRLGRCYERQDFLDLRGNDLVARWDFEEPPNAATLAACVDERPVRLNWNVRSLGTPHGHVLEFSGDHGYAVCGPLPLSGPRGRHHGHCLGKMGRRPQRGDLPDSGFLGTFLEAIPTSSDGDSCLSVRGPDCARQRAILPCLRSDAPCQRWQMAPFRRCLQRGHPVCLCGRRPRWSRPCDRCHSVLYGQCLGRTRGRLVGTMEGHG